GRASCKDLSLCCLCARPVRSASTSSGSAPCRYGATARWWCVGWFKEESYANQSGGLCGRICGIYAYGPESGPVAERQRAVACCRADPSDFDGACRGHWLARAHESPDPL